MASFFVTFLENSHNTLLMPLHAKATVECAPIRDGLESFLRNRNFIDFPSVVTLCAKRKRFIANSPRCYAGAIGTLRRSRSATFFRFRSRQIRLIHYLSHEYQHAKSCSKKARNSPVSGQLRVNCPPTRTSPKGKPKNT